MKIGLLSDTHGHLDEAILKHLTDCDEVWHAGDIGSIEIAEQLAAFKPCKMVHGNIDDVLVRDFCPEDQIFACEGLNVWMTHIGGYPPKYPLIIRKKLEKISPDIFICGHSHLLKVMRDDRHQLMHLNPGAAGHHGFHKIRTLLRFEVNAGRMQNMEVVELGKRGQLR